MFFKRGANSPKPSARVYPGRPPTADNRKVPMPNRFALALLLTAIAAPASAQTDIDAANLTQTVRTLASDQFQGRAPGTVGEERTVGYLIGRLEAMGLEPAGVDGGWTRSEEHTSELQSLMRISYA